MDESLQELENELKRLTPRAPSAALLHALEHGLGPAATAPAPAPARHYTSAHSWKWASWSLAGAAAAALLMAFLFTSHPLSETPVVANTPPDSAVPAATTVNRYEPVHASSVLYDLHESDPTMLPDRTEGREVRYRYVDTYTWKNPATNASVRWSVPRDEVRLVRASFD
jgi:hypothetical protein